MYRDIPEALRALIEPVVEDYGYELMNVEMPTASGATSLKITIDTRVGDGRVPVDDLVRISRELETHMSVNGGPSVNGGALSECELEVSSPGLDRMLTREKDFAAARGSEVKLALRRPVAGRRRFRGVLSDFENGVVRVVVDGERTEIPFAEVEKAHIVYAFTRADFNGARSGATSD